MYELINNNLVVLQNVIPNICPLYQLLNKIHDPNLRLRTGFDVSLGGAEIGVPGQHLDISERSADRGYLPCGICYESATPGVTRAAVEADVPVPSQEQVDDGLRRHSPRPFALDQEGAGRHPDRFELHPVPKTPS
jgi:hypothetical protein